LIRPRYVGILFYKELLRFMANPALWILLILFFCMGMLISLSDVILQRDRFNIVVHGGGDSSFLAFVDRHEPDVTLLSPWQLRTRKGLNRLVTLHLDSEDFDEELLSGKNPAMKISSVELSQAELGRLRDLLVKDAFLFLGVEAPLEIRIATLSGQTLRSIRDMELQSFEEPEDFKKLIMALLITISLNVVTFNLFTVTFAEEKQSRTLLAVLLSPARSTEVAVARCLFFLLPGVALTGSLVGVYRADLLLSPVLWATLICGAVLYMSMSLVLVSFVEKQSTASLICLGYLFFLSSMFILAPRFTALYPIKNHLPENFIFSILSFLFDRTSFAAYAGFFWSFVLASVVAPVAALGIFARRTASRGPPRGSERAHGQDH